MLESLKVTPMWGAAVVAASCWLAAGCATISSANTARPMDDHGKLSKKETTASGLRVTGEELIDLASRNFGALELTFENTTSDWVRIQRVYLHFGDAEVNRWVSVPRGQDLRNWYDSTLQRNAVRDENRALALGVVALTGLVVANAASSDGARAAGGLVGLGAATALGAELVREGLRSAETVQMFPESHLFAGPFGVPPRLFVKKWIALNTHEKLGALCVDRVVITYELEGRPYERVQLRYKGQSEWQREACTPRPPEHRTYP